MTVRQQEGRDRRHAPEELDRLIGAAAGRSRARRFPPLGPGGLAGAPGDRLDAAADDLVPLAAQETHLGIDRLQGELKRTTFQLRLFAEILRDGSFLQATIDHADPAWPMGARPDLRRMLRPIGPVAVYAASNFPFAFSVAGGDTASALAAGCPVLLKANPSHPELSAATGRRCPRRWPRPERRTGSSLWSWASRRDRSGQGPEDPRRVLHRLAPRWPGPVRPRRLATGTDPVLRRAWQREPGVRDAGCGCAAGR